MEVVVKQAEELVQIRLHTKIGKLLLNSLKFLLHVLFATQIVNNQWRNCRKDVCCCPQIHLIGTNIQFEGSQQFSKQKLEFVGPIDEKWRFFGEFSKNFDENGFSAYRAKTKLFTFCCVQGYI